MDQNQTDHGFFLDVVAKETTSRTGDAESERTAGDIFEATLKIDNLEDAKRFGNGLICEWGSRGVPDPALLLRRHLLIMISLFPEFDISIWDSFL